MCSYAITRNVLFISFDVSAKLTITQAGVGTYFQPGVVSPFFHLAARILDEALAWYLSEHIMDGYKFLMQNYHEGDSVSIFGSSIHIGDLFTR
jgi:uncharacterized protein (DUF2235 family)